MPTVKTGIKNPKGPFVKTAKAENIKNSNNPALFFCRAAYPQKKDNNESRMKIEKIIIIKKKPGSRALDIK